jgi:adhesin/invasin
VILLLHRVIRIAPMVLAIALSACGGADLTLPDDARPTHIDIVTGNAQAGIAGTNLSLPLVVKITDDLGRPVSGEAVQFTVQSGEGHVTPSTFSTDTGGRATTIWTLGATAGNQQVEARAVGGDAPDGLVVTFTATAVAGSGSLLTAVSGDDQAAAVNSAVPESLVVLASDAGGNPVSGITVVWTVQGGGSITPETVVTGNDGRAAALRVLGATAGQQTAQASADGLAGSPVTFVQTALASAPAALVKASGDNQMAPAGFEVAEDLVVQLRDAGGNGIGGRAVTWLVTPGSGTATPFNSTTDPQGFAHTRWTLGTSAGTNTLNAVYSGLDPVVFTAKASADVPSKLTLVSGDNQSGVVGQALANPLAVKVTDANNNPVENVSVDWTPNGGGSVSSATSATDANGVAQITRTLGATPGTFTTTAAVAQLDAPALTFTSTATAGQAARIVVVTQPGATLQNGATLSPQPAIQIQDALGNNVGLAGRTITAALVAPPSGASLGGDVTKQTDARGAAAFTDLRITGPAQGYTLRFTGSGLTDATSTQVTVTAGPVSPSRSTVDAGPNSVAAGASSTITVTARDGSGNPVSGATVVLAATGSGNTLTQPSGSTDASGVATGAFSSTSVGAHTISATINGTAITDKSTITVAAGPVSASQSTVVANPASIGAGAPSTITVTARDANGNPVQGASVQLSADGSGNTIGQPGPTNSSGVTTGTFSSTGLGPHTVSAKINGTAITDVATVTVTVGAPSTLVMARQPGGTAQDGAQLSPQPVVQVQDAQGNDVKTGGRSITASLVNPPAGATLGGDATRETDGSGSASFGNLSIIGPVGSYTLRFTSGSLTAATSSAISLTTGPVNAGNSTVNANPNSVQAGESSTITVTARDVGGNPIQGATVVLTASGGGNTIDQPNATNADGIATGAFSSTSVGSHTIKAKINGVDVSDNSVITVTAGPVSASQSTMKAAPDAITAGGGPSTVTVTARDAAGNPISGALVSLSVTGGGNTLSAPAATNANGVTTATFTSTEAGDHVITATINGVVIDDNSTVTVQAGPAASLNFTQQPTTTQAGQVITPAVVVTVLDQFGNPASGKVTMSLVVPPLASGSLNGTLSVTAAGGSATFSDLSVDTPAFLAYRLTASLGELSVTSDGFLVTP